MDQDHDTRLKFVVKTQPPPLPSMLNDFFKEFDPMAQMFHTILGYRETTYRSLGSGEADFTAEWEIDGAMEITVKLRMNAEVSDESFTLELNEDEAKQLLSTLQRFADHEWKFPRLAEG